MAMRRTLQWAILAFGILTIGFLGMSEAQAGVSFSFGVGFGSPYYYPMGPYYAPYWYPSFGWAGYYYPAPPANGYAPVAPHNGAPVEMHVNPKKATVTVDGTSVGQARDFDTKAYPLWLNTGSHVMELRHKGYQTLRVKFEVRKGRAYKVRYDLRQGEGTDPRSAAGPHESPGQAGY